jgi:hypothetical protein
MTDDDFQMRQLRRELEKYEDRDQQLARNKQQQYQQRCAEARAKGLTGKAFRAYTEPDYDPTVLTWQEREIAEQDRRDAQWRRWERR